jgi:hypothetical protein
MSIYGNQDEKTKSPDKMLALGDEVGGVHIFLEKIQSNNLVKRDKTYVKRGRFSPKSSIGADDGSVVNKSRSQELLVDVILPTHVFPICCV